MVEGGWGTCPSCQAKVKAANLSRHISRVHNDPELAKQYPVPPPDSGRPSPGGGRWRLGAFAVVIALFLAGMAFALAPPKAGNPPVEPKDDDVPPPEGIAVGNLAPDFTLTELDGARFSLSDFRGRPVAINFMAAWCGSCKLEMNQIKAIFDVYAAKGVVFLSVDIDPYSDSDADLRQYRADYGGGPGHIFAFDDPSEGVALRYEPTFDATWIIDQDGVILFTDRVITSQDTLASNLDRLV